jgi:hypothetical protein
MAAVAVSPRVGRPRKYFAEPGQRFGRLVALRETRIVTPGNPWGLWAAVCQCDCGEQVTVRLQFLFSGTTASCGCSRDEYRRSPEHLALLTRNGSSPENLARLAEYGRSPEHRERLARRNRSPENLARLAESARTPEARERSRRLLTELRQTPEIRARLAEISRNRSPEYLARLAEISRTPEARERARRLLRQWWSVPRMGSDHEPVSAPDTEMWCPVCGEQVASERAFDRHYRKHHRGGPRATRTA